MSSFYISVFIPHFLYLLCIFGLFSLLSKFAVFMTSAVRMAHVFVTAFNANAFVGFLESLFSLPDFHCLVSSFDSTLAPPHLSPRQHS